MPVDPDCDTGDCGDEPPDADPGCCGALTCEENETCCNNTTCVLTSSFQTDSNNCGGCDIVCGPGETCVDGACTGGGPMGCCTTYACTYLEEIEGYGWLLTSRLPAEGACPETFDPTTEDPACCTDVPPESACITTALRTWSAEPCPTEAQASYEAQIWDPRPCPGDPLTGEYSPNPWWFLSVACPEGYTSSPPDGLPTNPPPCEPYYFGMINPSVVGCCEGIVQRPCTAGGAGAMSYNPSSQLAFKEEPCSQEECEAHFSTWMAEPSGEPIEEGLYKVNCVLLDGCPGACCSDQPTQPEFVKSSTLVDAPCKCGCD